MPKLAVSFLGRDCPGIVAKVTRLLEQAQCDISEVTQTILAGEFAAIFLVQAPDAVDETVLLRHLQLGMETQCVDLSVIVRPAIQGTWGDGRELQPFVVTADGPNRPGLIAGLSQVFADHGVNIENLKAVLGEGGPDHALFVFEVMIPYTADPVRLRQDLVDRGKALSLRVSAQHRDIFEAVNRLTVV